MLKIKCIILAAMLLGVLQAEFPVKVMFYPSITRDDAKNIIFSDRISALGIYFFRSGEEIPRLENYKLTLDLPKSLRIRSAVVIEGWQPQQKINDFAPAGVPGKDFQRYTLPLPARELTTVFKIDEMVGFTGFFVLYWLEPSGNGEVPESFTAEWHMSGEGKQLTGTQLFQAIPFQPARKLPEKFEIWGDSGSANMDEAEISKQIELFKGMGITHVDGDQSNKFIPDYRKYFKDNGFRLYSGHLQQFIFRFDRPVITAPYKQEECLVGLDGKSIFGTNNYRNTPWCPAQFYNPESRLFKEMLSHVKQLKGQGVTDFFSDHELDFFRMCYCPVCIGDYAVFAGLDHEKLKKMTAYEIAAVNPEKFYRFRSHQSGRMCEELRKALGKDSGIRIGLNSAIIYLDYREGGLGWGRSLFADDPRLTDDQVDFHNLDSLTGSLMDSIQLDSFIRDMKKPVIARCHSNYCFGWEFAHCSTRHEQARAAGVKTGYDNRPQMQFLSMVNLAATGAHGVELLINNGSFDAAVANAVARGAEVIANYEAIWLNGKRIDEKLQVYLLPQPESPYYTDSSTIAGKYWAKFFLKLYGPLMYRAHEHDSELTISIFNWDAMQNQKLVVVPPDGYDNVMVYDRRQGLSYQHTGGKTVWTASELKNGISVEVPPLDVVILTLAPKYADGFEPSAVRIAAGSIPNGVKSYNPYHFRQTGESPLSLKNILQQVYSEYKK